MLANNAPFTSDDIDSRIEKNKNKNKTKQDITRTTTKKPHYI